MRDGVWGMGRLGLGEWGYSTRCGDGVWGMGCGEMGGGVLGVRGGDVEGRLVGG